MKPFLTALLFVAVIHSSNAWRRRRRNPPPPPPPVNGGWSGWGGFSACNRQCGGGNMYQYRYCNNPAPARGGSYCPGTNVNSAICNTHPCPVNGIWKDWGAYGSCSKSCGGGVKLRYRTCKGPLYGGKNCQGQASDSKPCNTHTCPDEPNSDIITATDGTRYQLVGCFNDHPRRLNQLLITERDHSSHAWNGEWIQWNDWNNYMEKFVDRCVLKVKSKNYKVFGMVYYAECWSDSGVSNALAHFPDNAKDLSKCVTKDYKDCKQGETRCIGKHYGVAVYQLIEA